MRSMADYDFSDLSDFSSDSSDLSSDLTDFSSVKSTITHTASGFKTVSLILSGLMTIAGLFFCYEMIFTSDWGFEVEWNMFKSPLVYPLWFVGLIIAIFRFGKTHWSFDEVIETEDSWGNKKLWVNNDITSVLFGRLLWPILGHLVIEPLMYAALIYYPLMCILYLVGAFLPYILSVLVLLLCAASFKADLLPDFPYKNIILSAASLLFTSGFVYGGWSIMKGSVFESLPTLEEVIERVDPVRRSGDSQQQESNEVDFEDFPTPATSNGSAADDINEDDFE